MAGARTWIPRGLGVCAFVLYATAAPGGMWWLDSPELSGAAIRLGASHPTGFPLYMVLGKLSSLFPIGELAFRMNLLSAVCAAVAVALTSRLVQEVCGDDVAGIAGGVAAAATVGLSLTFFRQATVAEVYAPTAAVMAWAVLLLYRVGRGADGRTGLVLAAACGLGLGTHVSFAMLMGVPVAVLLVVRLRHGARWPLIAPVVTLAVAAALYSYFPIRSANADIAGVDWGHPRDAGRLADYVSAGNLRAAFGDEMWSSNPDIVGHHASSFAHSVVDQLGPIALVLAAFGAVWLVTRRDTRWLLLALGIIALGDAVYAFWINPMGLRDLQNGVPLSLALAALAGVGVASFARQFGKSAAYAGAAVGVMVALQAPLMSWSEIAPSRTGDLARTWSEAALDQTPPRGVVLTQSDSTSAGTGYLSAVEGARPDVSVLVRQFLRPDPQTASALLGSPVDPRAPIASVARTGRPIVWEMGDDGIPRGAVLVQGVPLSLLGPGPLRDGSDIERAVSRLRSLYTGAGTGDRISRRVFAHALTNLGRAAYGRRDAAAAELLFSMALAIDPDHAEALTNLGVVLAATGRALAAIAVTDRAIEVDPTRLTALVNAARYRAATGDIAGAVRYARRALRIRPDDPRALALVR